MKMVNRRMKRKGHKRCHEKKTSSKATGVDIVEIFQFEEMEWMNWTVLRAVLSCWVDGSNSLRRNKSWANKLHGPKESYSLWLHCVFHFSTGTGREKQREGHLPGTACHRRKYRSQEGGTAQSAGLCRYDRNKESDVLSSPIKMGKLSHKPPLL